MPWWWTFGEVPEVPGADLLKLVNAGKQDPSQKPQILDVRTEGEYKEGHIEGAVWCGFLPAIGFRERLLKVPLDKTKPVYPICLSAHRSIAAQKLLTELGFQAFQLQGGMQAWRKENFPEVKEPAAAGK